MKQTSKGVLFIVALVGFMYLTMSPNLQFMRDTLWYRITFYLLIDAGIIYVMFHQSFKTTNPTKVILGLILLIPILSTLDFGIKSRLLLIYFLGLTIVLTTLLVYYSKFRNNLPKRQFERIPLVIGMIIMLVSLNTVVRFNYLSGTNNVWLYSALFAAVLTGVSILIVIKYKNDINEQQNIYFIPLVTFMASAAFIGLTSLFLNYTLDDSNPTYLQVEIVDMSIDTGYRTLTSYDLTVSYLNIEFDIGTSQSAYHQLEIGDDIYISYYEGAFGIKYYLYEPWVIID